VKLFNNYDETLERKEKDNHKKTCNGFVLIFALLGQFLSGIGFPSEVEKKNCQQTREN